MSYLSIGEAAALLGVATSTLRRWEAEGRLLPSFRTPGGHRRYAYPDLRTLIDPAAAEQPSRITVCYARVSSHDQKADLERQAQRLRRWCEAEGVSNIEMICDLGSGLNYRKKGLRRLLRMIALGQLGRLVITHKDCLLRFGSELIFELCRLNGVDVVVIEAEAAPTYEQQLSADVIELMTVFSARLYGARSHRNRQAKEAA